MAVTERSDAASTVEAYAPRCWPTTDPTALGVAAHTLVGLGRELDGIADVIERAFLRMPAGAGAAAARVHDSAAVVADGDMSVRAMAGLIGGLAARLAEFSDVTVAARELMTVLASIAERDRLAAAVRAGTGDDSGRVIAASAGRLALTAAGDDYASRAEEIAARDTGHDPVSAASGAVMPMGAGGLAGLGMAAVGARTGRGHPARRTELSRAEVQSLLRRVDEVTVSLPTAGWVNAAVGIAVHSSGRRVVVVGTSDPVPYRRVGMTIRPDEELVGDGRPPEIAVIAHMVAEGLRPMAVASAARPTSAARAYLLAHAVTSLVAPGTQ